MNTLRNTAQKLGMNNKPAKDRYKFCPNKRKFVAVLIKPAWKKRRGDPDLLTLGKKKVLVQIYHHHTSQLISSPWQFP